MLSDATYTTTRSAAMQSRREHTQSEPYRDVTDSTRTEYKHGWYLKHHRPLPRITCMSLIVCVRPLPRTIFSRTGVVPCDSPDCSAEQAIPSQATIWEHLRKSTARHII